MTDSEDEFTDEMRYEEALIAAEDDLFEAVVHAPTEVERRILLGEFHTVLMCRYSRFPATWGDDDGPETYLDHHAAALEDEGGDADGD